MQALLVVPGFYPMRHMPSHRVPVGSMQLRDAFPFQRGEETFSLGIVVAVARSTYRLRHIVSLTELAKFLRSVLRATIGVMNDRASAIRSSSNGRFQRSAHQVRVLTTRHRPADDAARCRIHDDRKIKHALTRMKIRRIGHPNPVELVRGESTLDMIVDARSSRIRMRRLPALFRSSALQPHGSHETSHTRQSDLKALSFQIRMHPRRAVGVVARFEQASNRVAQAGIQPIMFGHASFARLVVGTWGDAQHAAHESDREFLFAGVDQSIRRIPPGSGSHSLANQDAAFVVKFPGWRHAVNPTAGRR